MDGSEDHLIDSSAQHFWERLEMPAVRLRIQAEVRRLMEQQVLKYWSDAGDLVEQHDPHRAAYEGEEYAVIEDADE